jgi:hypothetical protein
MKKLLCNFVAVLFVCTAIAQPGGVSINHDGAPPDTSAMLDVNAINKGMLFPRLTTEQRDSIHLPAIGLLVYNTTTSTFDYYTGTSWFSLASASTTSAVPIIRTYTSNAIWTKPPGLKYIVVEMVGGGGGGGGCYNYGGGAGAAGGYSKKIISTSALSSTESVTVGLSGSGGAPQLPGGDGGTTSFGSHCSATGGQGGKAQTSLIYTTDGSLGGISIGGDLNLNGSGSGGALGVGPLYAGSPSYFGGSAIPVNQGVSGDGYNATSYGAGGSGGNGYNSPNKTGGNGSGGIVIITEYY